MAVYDLNKPRRDNGKLYRGVYRNSAADLPPQNKCKDICRKENEPVIGDIKPKNDKKFFDGIIDEFFDGGVDSDKLLIAALLYILIKEGADIKLIIALGYILM
jgi:hypothetical protein